METAAAAMEIYVVFHDQCSARMYTAPRSNGVYTMPPCVSDPTTITRAAETGSAHALRYTVAVYRVRTAAKDTEAIRTRVDERNLARGAAAERKTASEIYGV